MAWARERGRISSSEYRQMTGVSQATATKRLKELAEQGRIAPASESGRGRGFHYRPFDQPIVHSTTDVAYGVALGDTTRLVTHLCKKDS